MNSEATQRRCPNCQAPLSGPYCASCGQKEPRADPSLGELLKEAFTELTSWDGKVLGTLKTLVSRPGRLTVDFLAGRRARWLSPLRLYLICSIGYFLVTPALEALSGEDQSAMKITVTGADRPVAPAAGENQLTPQAVEDLERTFLGSLVGRHRIEKVIQNPEAFARFFRESMPKAMFLLLPLLALLVNLAYRRRAPRYPRHLYFALHLHAFAFLALAIAALVPLLRVEWIATAGKIAVLAVIIWYLVAAMRTVYGGSRGATLARAVAIGVVYLLCFLLVAAATAVIALMVY
jgi:Protein of unknown function (DUF3667)